MVHAKGSGGGNSYGKEEDEEFPQSLGGFDDHDHDRTPYSPSCSSTLLPNLSPPLMEAVVIKEEVEEEEDLMILEDNNNSSSSSSSTAAFSVPKPMEGLNEASPPPFLRKTLQIVEDPETNSVVSRSRNKHSFIVWDQHELSKYLLPKCFKHGNFSGFIRQLNTYIGGNLQMKDFKGGKRHLLKNIKRRVRNNKHRLGSTSVADKRTTFYKSNELEILRSDQETLKGEIIRLRQQEEESQSMISEMEERIRCFESRQQNIFMFLAKAVKISNFVEKLMEKRKQSTTELGAVGAMIRKRKLLEIAIPEPVHEPKLDLKLIGNTNQAFCEVPVTWDSVTGSTSEVALKSLGVNRGQIGLPDLLPEKRPEPIPEDCVVHASCIYEAAMCGNPLGKNMVLEEGEEEEVDVDDSKIYLELENLTEKPLGWEGPLGVSPRNQQLVLDSSIKQVHIPEANFIELHGTVCHKP